MKQISFFLCQTIIFFITIGCSQEVDEESLRENNEQSNISNLKTYPEPIHPEPSEEELQFASFYGTDSLVVDFATAAILQNTSHIEYPVCVKFDQSVSNYYRTEEAKNKQRDTIITLMEKAFNLWVKALKGEHLWQVDSVKVYKVLPNPVTNSCVPQSRTESINDLLRIYVVNVKKIGHARNYLAGWLSMTIDPRLINLPVITHETGHAVGLGDTYDKPAAIPDGQPPSVMNLRSRPSMLSTDDIDGIKFIWRRRSVGFSSKNGCPYGYKRDTVKNEHGEDVTRRYYSVFCVKDKNFDINNVDPHMYSTKNNGVLGDKVEFCQKIQSKMKLYKSDSLCRENNTNGDMMRKMCKDSCTSINIHFDDIYKQQEYEENNVVEKKYWSRTRNAQSMGAWGPENAFDDSPRSSWIFKPLLISRFNSRWNIAWIRVDHSIGFLLKKYTIQIGKREGWSLERAPKKWVLKARNSSGTWKTIDMRSGITWSQEGEKKEFVVNTTEKFNQYVIAIKENSSNKTRSKNQVEIADIDYIYDK